MLILAALLMAAPAAEPYCYNDVLTGDPAHDGCDEIGKPPKNPAPEDPNGNDPDRYNGPAVGPDNGGPPPPGWNGQTTTHAP